jgi:hypothetical protein
MPSLIEEANRMFEDQIKTSSKEAIKTCGMGHVFPTYPELYYTRTFQTSEE